MLGVDVSNWQGQVDWAALKTAGVGFGFIKATEGINYTDSQFARNRAQAADNGIPVGAYHFIRPDKGNSAYAEANYFCDVVGAIQANELRPVIDLEHPNVDPLPPAPAVGWVQALLKEIERRLGVRPIIYSYSAYLGAKDWSGLKTWPLWLANYGPNAGTQHPYPDPGFRVVCHQYSSVGEVAGRKLDVNECPDLNLLREAGDYLVYRDWVLAMDGSPRPLGTPTSTPKRWTDLLNADMLEIADLISVGQQPLDEKIAALTAEKDKLAGDLTAMTSEYDKLRVKIAAAQAALS